VTKKLKEGRLQRLNDLADDRPEQLIYARRLLESEKDRQTLEAALKVLQEFPDLDNRPLLVKAYKNFAENGPKRDPGMYLRAAILRALRPLTRQDDLGLLEQAVLTYELMPSRHDAEGAELRALALSILNDLDEVRASFYAVKLLVDKVTSEMSGEPALTAARILAAQEHSLPLYQYLVSQGEKSSEVVAACLRGQTALPDALLGHLVETYRASSSEIILLGLFDLLLIHPKGTNYSEVFSGFLASTGSFNLYRYVVMALITGGKTALLGGFLEQVLRERDPLKRDIILELLPLIRGDEHKAAVEAAYEKFGKGKN
jgi:hypothetical protein